LNTIHGLGLWPNCIWQVVDVVLSIFSMTVGFSFVVNPMFHNSLV